jgi:hypothetical protein
MSRQFAYTAGRRRVRAAATAALLLVVGLFVSSLGATPSDAATQPSLLVSVSTDNSSLTGAPGAAVPTVLAAKGSAIINVTVTVSDGTDLTKGTVINLTPVRADSANPLGSFVPGSFSVPVKGSTFTFPVAYSAAEDGIALRAALKKTTSTSPLPGQSQYFDVLETLKFTAKGDPSLATGLGADTCNNKSTVSVCGVVVLPKGIGSPAAALSTGSCTDDLCTGGKEVQFIAGLTDDTGADLYSRTNPATLVLQCDKTKCKGTGVPNFTAKLALSATGALTVSPACTTKGVIQEGVDFCTDYQNSRRNNVGDLLLNVLFFRDMRGTI